VGQTYKTPVEDPGYAGLKLAVNNNSDGLTGCGTQPWTCCESSELWDGIMDAIDFVLANKRPGVTPILMFLSDAYDFSARYTFQQVYDRLNLLNQDSTTLRLFGIIVGAGDTAKMHQLATVGDGAYAFSSTGSDVDSIFNGMGQMIFTAAAIQINPTTTPMFVDVLGKDIHYVPGSLLIRTDSANYIRPGRVAWKYDTVVSPTGQYGRFVFDIDTINVNEVLVLQYKITAALHKFGFADFGYPMPVNNSILDDAVAYSRFKYRTLQGTTVEKPIDKAIINVKNKKTGPYISLGSNALRPPDSAGTHTITLIYGNVTAAQYGSLNLFTVFKEDNTDSSQITNPAGLWRFAAKTGWTALTAETNVDYSTGAASSRYFGLRIAGDSSLAGRDTLWVKDVVGATTDYLVLNAVYQRENEFFSNIFITDQANGTSGLPNFTVTGDTNYLKNYSLLLYAIGATNLGHYNPVTGAVWNSTSSTKLSVGTGSTNTLSFNLPSLGNAPRSRTEVVSISYNDPSGGMKRDSLTITIVDNTDYDTVDVLSIVPDTAYRNASNKNALYTTYNTVNTYTPYGGDTVKLSGLLFDLNSGGPKFLGSANVGFDTGRVVWTLNGQAYSTDSVFKYYNQVPGKTDTVVAIYTSGGKTVRDTLYLAWKFGRARLLSIESAPGIVGQRGNGSLSVVTFTTAVSKDTVYAVIRDENGYCVTNVLTDSVHWSLVNPTVASQYLSVPPADSGKMACIIGKLQNPADSMSFTLTATLNGQYIAGEYGQDSGTVEIRLANYSFDRVGIFADSSNHFDLAQQLTGVVNTLGKNYKRVPADSAQIGASDTLRLVAIEDVVVLKGALHRNDKNLWEENSVTWTFSDKSWLMDTVFSASSRITLRPKAAAGSKVSLTASYNTGTGTVTSTIWIVVEPPHVANYVMTPVTPVPAGTPISVTWTAVDVNGNIVRDPLRQPDSVCLYLENADHPVQVIDSHGDTVTMTGGTNKYCGLSQFVNGQLVNNFYSTVADSFRIKYVIYNDGKATVKYADLVVTPGAGHHIRIVYRGTLLDAVRDTLTPFGADAMTVRSYTALLFDVYDNLVTDASALGNIGWQALHGGNLSRAGVDAVYDARQQAGGNYLDTVTASYVTGGQVQFSDYVVVWVLPIVEVQSVVTHEWVPDTGLSGLQTIRFVLDSVLGAGAAAVASDTAWGATVSANQRYLNALWHYGYPGGRDGYLDYLDINMSTGVIVRTANVLGVLFDTLVDGTRDTVKWVMADTVDGRIIRPYLQLLDPGVGMHYRLWLVTNAVATASTGPLETGFLPEVKFDNAAIQGANVLPLRLGSADDVYETLPSAVVDSAAPVVDKFIYENNKCNPARKLNSVQITFSEPVSQLPSGSFPSITALSLVNSGVDDTFFMTSRISDVITNNRVYNKWQAWDLQSGSGTMAYELEIRGDAEAYFRPNEALMRFNPVNGNRQLLDYAGNSGSGGENRKARLENDDSQPVLCNVSGPTIVNRYDALNYSWTTITEDGKPVDVPLFSYFGFDVKLDISASINTLQNMVLINNCGNYEYWDYPANDILLHADVAIFDLLGNLVASPSANKSLRIDYTASDIKRIFGMPLGVPQCGAIDTSKYDILQKPGGAKPDLLIPKYPSVLSFGYKVLLDNKNSSTPVVPMWNCLNAKGRLVAPSGYIVIQSITVLGQPMPNVTRKLVVTSKKKGQLAF
jgi:hypothetical protein